MVAYLTKSDASEGFHQIINFLNGSYIKYALTVNPNIYVSCIKQFWNTVAIKQVNYVTRLKALVDKKRVVVTEAAIRDVLCLDDAEGVDFLPNEEIFTELARIGYENPSTKLMFYKAFFSRQEIEEKGDVDEHVEDVIAGDDAHEDDTAAHGEVPIRVDTSDDTMMDDESNLGRMIAEMYKDDAVVLMDDKEEDKKEEEAKVVEIPAATLTAALAKVAAAPTRKRKGVAIRDPEEESTTSTIIPEIKKKQQIEMDEKYARKLHAELNKDIDWDVAIDHVKLKAKEDLAIKRYQAMKRKPQT
nr:xylulose kinase-1 [Tanacetum cinerariifolium]